MSHFPGLAVAPRPASQHHVVPKPAHLNATSVNTAAGMSASTSKKVSIGGASAAGGSTTASPSAPTAASYEAALITNLKQQVAVLEVELRYLRSGQPAASSAVNQLQQSSTAHGGGHTDPAAASMRPAVPGAPDASSASIGVGLPATHGDVLRHLALLQTEVGDLRSKYARREKEHAVEMAELRRRFEHGLMGGSSDGVKGDGNAMQAQSVVERLQGEIANLKQHHATQVVALEKTVERLKAETHSHSVDMAAISKEKDSLLRDLITAKDTGRAAITNHEVVQRQFHEALQQLSVEQDRRRQLETREKEQSDAVTVTAQREQLSRAHAKIEELEQEIKRLTTFTFTAKYDMEQARASEQKSKADYGELASQQSETLSREAKLKDQVGTLERAVTTLTSGNADKESERDFYRVASDRLKVENTILQVKISQLDAKINSDKGSILTLERQYCQSMETVEQLRRELKSKEDLYTRLDGTDDSLRRENKLLVEENQKLKQANAEQRGYLVELSTKYDAIKGTAEFSKTEQQMQSALGKLERTKQEMHTMLQTQLRLSHDLSEAVGDFPDASTVFRAMTSGMSPVPGSASVAAANPAGNATGAVGVTAGHAALDGAAVEAPSGVALPAAPRPASVLGSNPADVSSTNAALFLSPSNATSSH